MIEFSSETGGRFTYVDDVLNLQELALAFSAIFDDCDNFIVSGCEVTGNAIAPGVVYLNGKLRTFNGASDIESWPQYIYELNTTEDVTYQSGGKKLGRKVWGCTLGAEISTPSGQSIPQSITITAAGGLRMKDAWLGKYAVLLSPSGQAQTIAGTLSADKLSTQQIEAGKQITIKTSGGTARLYYDNGDFVVESSIDASNKYRLALSLEGIVLYKNATPIATFSDRSVTFARPINAVQATVDGVNIVNHHIYDTATEGDSGWLSINMLGYKGSTSCHRDTFIGNGKDKSLLTVLGQLNRVNVDCPFYVYSTQHNFITLASHEYIDDYSLRAIISWTAAGAMPMATLGFNETTSQLFTLSSLVGEIKISGVNYVDIAPLIKEGGTLLSDKYVLSDIFTTELAKKANNSSVYSRTEADARYAALNGGLSQFISSTKTKEALCGEIGALTTSSLSAYPTLANCLSDMATSEALKKQIRDNIGAAGKEEYQDKLADTGWMKIVDDLYARQIGDIVSVQGTMTAKVEGTAFTLPNSICAPRYTVNCNSLGFAGAYWSGRIEGGKKACTVVRSSTISGAIPISFTYMI